MYSDGGKNRQPASNSNINVPSAAMPGHGARLPGAAGTAKRRGEERDDQVGEDEPMNAVAVCGRQREYDTRGDRDAQHDLPEQPLVGLERRALVAIGHWHPEDHGSRQPEDDESVNGGHEEIRSVTRSKLEIDELRASEVSEEQREIARCSVDGVSHAHRQARHGQHVVEPRLAQVYSHERSRVEQERNQETRYVDRRRCEVTIRPVVRSRICPADRDLKMSQP